MALPNFENAGAQQYIKWQITEDLSLRYYFLFQDRKHYENKYFLKSHRKKVYEEITSEIIIEELMKASSSCINVVARREEKKYIKYKGTFGEQSLIMDYKHPKKEVQKETIADFSDIISYRDNLLQAGYYDV